MGTTEMSGVSPVQPLPRVAVAMGDPAGIGPEIVVKALAEPEIYQACVPVVIGDARVLAEAPGWRGEPRIVRVGDVGDARPEPGVMAVLDLANVPASLKRAEVSVEAGRCSIDYLARGVELNLAGKAEALVSAPLNKEAMKRAGFHFTDEYDYMASLCKTTDYTMLMVSPHFTLASVTLHAAMKDVPALLTRERILFTIRVSDAVARASGVARPRIGVAALNPHGGEGGTLGREELDAIRPAIEAARDEGIDASGPFPADTFFMTAKDSRYDVYVSLYHDQGRIAMKLLDFGHAVTMAEGLPFVFCTVGHGTAFDIAGKGVARHDNLKEAILLGAKRAVARRKG